MTVGILGLGLIGGSFARAFALAGHTVYAAEKDETMLSFSMLAGAVHGKLENEAIAKCDLILLAIYPDGSANPMAGSQFSGFKYSRADLFEGAPMVLVPHEFDNMQLLERVKKALEPCRFGSFSVCTALEHDRLIAFTSQMPHVLSNAFIKSPTAQEHKGFSAGSYKDLTRVAWLNANMWAQLCMSNRENMLFELDTYIESLKAYREALQAEDLQTLTSLLEEGKLRKEEVDG